MCPCTVRNDNMNSIGFECQDIRDGRIEDIEGCMRLLRNDVGTQTLLMNRRRLADAHKDKSDLVAPLTTPRR